MALDERRPVLEVVAVLQSSEVPAGDLSGQVALPIARRVLDRIRVLLGRLVLSLKSPAIWNVPPSLQEGRVVQHRVELWSHTIGSIQPTVLSQILVDGVPQLSAVDGVPGAILDHVDHIDQQEHACSMFFQLSRAGRSSDPCEKVAKYGHQGSTLGCSRLQDTGFRRARRPLRGEHIFGRQLADVTGPCPGNIAMGIQGCEWNKFEHGCSPAPLQRSIHINTLSRNFVSDPLCNVIVEIRRSDAKRLERCDQLAAMHVEDTAYEEHVHVVVQDMPGGIAQCPQQVVAHNSIGHECPTQ